MRTPCIGICQAPEGVCVACGRTLGEIAAWGRLSDAERERVMQVAAQRRRESVLQSVSLDSALGDSAIQRGRN